MVTDSEFGSLAGITCRWAGTHGPSDALAQQYLKGSDSRGAPESASAGASEAQNGDAVEQVADAALRGASLEVVPPEQAPQPETTGNLSPHMKLNRDEPSAFAVLV